MGPESVCVVNCDKLNNVELNNDGFGNIVTCECISKARVSCVRCGANIEVKCVCVDLKKQFFPCFFRCDWPCYTHTHTHTHSLSLSLSLSLFLSHTHTHTLSLSLSLLLDLSPLKLTLSCSNCQAFEGVPGEEFFWGVEKEREKKKKYKISIKWVKISQSHTSQTHRDGCHELYSSFKNINAICMSQRWVKLWCVCVCGQVCLCSFECVSVRGFLFSIRIHSHNLQFATH